MCKVELRVHSSVDPKLVSFDSNSPLNQEVSPELRAHLAAFVLHLSHTFDLTASYPSLQ